MRSSLNGALGAYREGMESINVKQAVNGQIMGAPGWKGFHQAQPQGRNTSKAPQRKQTLHDELQHLKSFSVCLRNTTRETEVSTPHLPSKVLSNNTDHVPNGLSAKNRTIVFPLLKQPGWKINARGTFILTFEAHCKFLAGHLSTEGVAPK